MSQNDSGYAEAIFKLGDQIDRAIGESLGSGLTDKDVITELRRIADEIEAEGV